MMKKKRSLRFWHSAYVTSIFVMVGLIFGGSVLSSYLDSMVPMWIGACIGLAIALFCIFKLRCPACGYNLTRILRKDGCYCPGCGKFIHPDDLPNQ